MRSLRDQNMQVCTLIVIATVAGFINKQNQVIKTQLIHLTASFSEDACLLSPDHSLGFTTDVINQIVENCESLNTDEDAFEHVDVWNTSLAQEIEGCPTHAL